MLNNLYTHEGENLTGTPWQVYPRPQMRRESYVNLNGEWEFSAGNVTFDSTILVPFCPESLLSGIGKHFAEGTPLNYRRYFSLPQDFNRGRVLLHIGAADQSVACFINGKYLGESVGITAVTFDITHALQMGQNEIKLSCQDDLRNTAIPYGKQVLPEKRGGMWYTPVSGIWQTVWLESVPEQYIEHLDIQVTAQSATVTVTPATDGVVVLEGKRYPLQEGKAEVFPENPHLWSPEDPYLYHFAVETQTDRVESYFALRTLEIKEFAGIPRLCLNGEPYFFHGLLDQGYWSDGIYTPASPACYETDILEMKRLGFNTLRKHIKIEPEQFYYDCDRLGMVVFQDMVNNGDYRFFRDTLLPTVGYQVRNDRKLHKNELSRAWFLDTMAATVKQLKNHPCICYWTIFNEGWGQFCSDDAYRLLKSLDSTRFIDTTSGWFRGSQTDVDSRHIYFTPWRTLQPSDKPLVLSEFGGYTYAVPGHLFNPDKSYGYKTCKTMEQFQAAISELYITRVLPAVERGLCAAICTQVSDVEDEINGMLTYDRKVNKADEELMQQLARALRDAFSQSCGLNTHTDTSPED